MDRLWTPWRYSYVTRADSPGRRGVPAAFSAWPGEDRQCVFCNMMGAVEWAKQSGVPDEDAARAAEVFAQRQLLAEIVVEQLLDLNLDVVG